MPGPKPIPNASPRVAQLNVKSLSLLPQEEAAKVKETAGFDAPEAMAAAAAVAAAAIKPGKERWTIKTGTDKDAPRVGTEPVGGANSAGIVDTTVAEMIELQRPAGMTNVRKDNPAFKTKRAEPVEFTIWQLKADIIAIKKEADGDLHIVLQGPSGETMVAESPTPRSPFVGDKSPWLDAMKEVRNNIADQFGARLAGAVLQSTAPGAAMFRAPATHPQGDAALFEALQPFKTQVEPTPAVVTGVGFFDKVHDQMGVAKNGIELHPILDIKFT
jgi:hypothetical protein